MDASERQERMEPEKGMDTGEKEEVGGEYSEKISTKKKRQGSLPYLFFTWLILDLFRRVLFYWRSFG